MAEDGHDPVPTRSTPVPTTVHTKWNEPVDVPLEDGPLIEEVEAVLPGGKTEEELMEYVKNRAKDVDLHSWAEKDKEDLQKAQARYGLTPGDKIDEAQSLKEAGTTALKAGKPSVARKDYGKAVEIVKAQHEFISSVDSKAANELHIACLLNAAQCSLKLGEWHDAATLCSTALTTRVPGLPLPTASRLKALFRRGCARIKTGDYDDARADLKEACTLDPKSKEVREAYASIKKAEAAANAKAKGVYASMFKDPPSTKRCSPDEEPVGVA